MHEYDTALKSVLRKTGDTVLRDLTGFAIERWHSVELQDVRRRSVDLLGEASGGQLIHIELQSRNDSDMAIRMAEYALMIFRGFRRFPEQVVLYVGEPPLRMEDRIAGTRVSFACRMVDIRELDGERLLESPRLEDNVIAILAKLNDQRSAVRRILGRIAESESPERTVALSELMILAGLRKLDEVSEQEISQMPILDDIMDHAVLGREFRRGLAQGKQDGERILILKLIEKRFGPIPPSAKQKLDDTGIAELEAIGLRLLDARTLEELLR